MKKNVILILAFGLVAAFGAINNSPQEHQSQPARNETIASRLVELQRQEPRPPESKRKHEAVVLWAYQGGNGVFDGKEYTYYYDGAQIYASSSSDGAPKFTQGSIPSRTTMTELGEGIAILLNDGYHIEKAGDNGETFLFVK